MIQNVFHAILQRYMKTFRQSLVLVFVTFRHKCLTENFDNISVIISTNNIIPILLLVFHLMQAFGTAKGFVNLINKHKIVSISISRSFYALVNFNKAIWLL